MFCQRSSAASSSQRFSSSVSFPDSSPNQREFAGVRPDISAEASVRTPSVPVPSIKSACFSRAIDAFCWVGSEATTPIVSKPTPRRG
jgi:hypothetical protein